MRREYIDTSTILMSFLAVHGAWGAFSLDSEGHIRVLVKHFAYSNW